MNEERLSQRLSDGHERIERRGRVLEYGLEAPTQMPLDLRRRLPSEEDFARRWLEESRENAHQRRFSTSGLPDEADAISLAYRQRYVVQGRSSAESGAKDDRRLAGFEETHRLTG
jgi:hypothetical protein